MRKHVVVSTGGGAGAFGKILQNGGCSSWFLEGLIPYSKKSLTDFLGYEPDKFCSPYTARKIALSAFHRARKLSGENDVVGIGCTATLALANGQGERANRQHKFYIALQDLSSTYCFSFCLPEGLCRYDEELLVAERIYKMALGQDCWPFDSEGHAHDCWGMKDVLVGEKKYVYTSKDPTNHPIIYCGSFNPIHEGHEDVINWCHEIFGRSPYLEITIANPDKAPLDYIDMRDRLDGIYESKATIAGVIISGTPRFVDKSYRYLSPTFIVGMDTFNRIFDVRYYKNHEELLDFIGHCKANNTKFFVLDRKGHEPYGHYIQRYQLEKIVTFVPKTQYEDAKGVSSTKIRQLLETTEA